MIEPDAGVALVAQVMAAALNAAAAGELLEQEHPTSDGSPIPDDLRHLLVELDTADGRGSDPAALWRLLEALDVTTPDQFRRLLRLVLLTGVVAAAAASAGSAEWSATWRYVGFFAPANNNDGPAAA